jgi:hypothetical protein
MIERAPSPPPSLPQDAFERWWEHLDLEDRDEFRFVFGGDEIHARFVCALDTLIAQNADPRYHKSLIASAYATAAAPYQGFAMDIDDPRLLGRAAKAYEHDAVQSLLERLKFRTTRRKRIKLENLVYSEVEAMIKDAAARDESDQPLYSMQDRKLAMDSAQKLLGLANEEEAVTRAERTRRGMARAREALQANLHDENPRVLKATLKAIVAKLPKDDVRAIIASIGEPAIEAVEVISAD